MCSLRSQLQDERDRRNLFSTNRNQSYAKCKDVGQTARCRDQTKFVAAVSLLGSFTDGNLPSKQEKVMVAKRTPLRPQDPQESAFGGVSDTHSSKLERPERALEASRKQEQDQRLALEKARQVNAPNFKP